MAILFLVATPIGNLEDMSPRALRVLSEASLIAAEDTRHSRKLLNHFAITTPLTSYFEHSQATKLDGILARLDSGSDVALISDAGTPAINDPGYQLVRVVLDAGHEVSPIPGPSAPIAALAASGLPTDRFLYLGYLPRKAKARREFLAAHAAQRHTLILLETPHRLQASLTDMLSVLGDRQIAIAAELTKKFERFFRGPLSEATSIYAKEPARGEFTLIVQAPALDSELWDEEQVRDALLAGFEERHSPSQLARAVASQSGWSRSRVYDLLQKLNKE